MVVDDSSELLLRFDPPFESGGPYQVEAIIDGLGLWTGGQVQLSPEKLDDAASPTEYGTNLWNALAGGWPDIESIFSKAWGSGKQKVRLRLMLNPNAADLHRIKWELLLPRRDSMPAGVNPLRPVSRFLPLPSLPQVTQGSGLTILLAIANPSNLKPPLAPIDVESEVASFFDVLKTQIREGQVKLSVLAGRTGVSDVLAKNLKELGCELIPSASTSASIAEHLSGKHVLHLIAHGNFKGDTPVLVLENDTGALDVPKIDETLVQWANNQPRFVFLQSCRSDPQDKALPLAGLGPSFLVQGVPAVVAMRDFVAMDAAHNFAAGFYRKLLECGEVDAAANAGRNETYKLKSDGWSIPILYSRLRSDERLWEPDALRQSVQALAAQLQERPEVRVPFPVEVTVNKNVDTVRSELDQPSSDTRVDALTTAKAELSSSTQQSKIVVLLGGRGRAKSAVLRKLFVDLAAESALKQSACPLLVNMADCKIGVDEVAAIEIAWSRMRLGERVEFPQTPLYRQLKGCAISLLVDGADDVGEAELKEHLDHLKRFVQASNRSALISMDNAVFDSSLFDAEQTTVLIVQDLRPEPLKNYLDAYRTGEDGTPLPDQTKALLTGPFRDLAGIPWLLSRILQLAALSPDNLSSRFRVLSRIVRDRLAEIAVTPGARTLARLALQEMAWRLHSRRLTQLSLSETYTLLSVIRGSRDFPLDTFREALLECRLLVGAGPEGVRFSYSAAQAYFTACYLNELPPDDRDEKLREIVSGLGKLERLRLWQEVLALLSGHMDKPEILLRMLLELGFGESDHLLLAAMCVHEARSAGKLIKQELISELTDALIWWASPNSGLAARSRRRAVEAFGYLLPDPGVDTQTLPNNARDDVRRIIYFLVHLVLDRGRVDSFGRRQLEYSNIRLEALSLLFRHQALILARLNDPAYKLANRDEIIKLVTAWLHGDLPALSAYLNDDSTDDAKSLLAGLSAFALVTWGVPDAIDCLQKRFLRCPINEDLHWLIIDGLIELHSAACMRLVRQVVESTDAVDPALKKFVVYAIGKLGSTLAESKEMEYLEQQLASDEVAVQGRAIRACAEVLGTTLHPRSDVLRQVCHMILRGRYSEAQRMLHANEKRRLGRYNRKLMLTYSLDALSHIGNKESLNVLREFYCRPSAHGPNPQEDALRKRSWETAERIRLRMQDTPPATTQSAHA